MKYLLFLIILFLSSCGGGGGGSSSASTTPTVYCINSQTAGCSFSTSDTTQSPIGWWKGTRTLNYTGASINAYAAFTNLGAYQIFLGDALNQGDIYGTVQVQGSAFTTVAGYGNDANSGGNGVGEPTARMMNSTGGVITNSILNFNAPDYALLIGITTTNGAATFNFTYDTDGDLPISNYAGTYSSGTQTLTINANGNLSLSSYNSVYNANLGQYVNTPCLNNYTTTPTASISSLALTPSSTTCTNSGTLLLFSYTVAGTRYMVPLSPPQSPTNYNGAYVPTLFH